MPLAAFCVATLIGAVLMLALGPYRYGGAPAPRGRGQVSMLVSEG